MPVMVHAPALAIRLLICLSLAGPACKPGAGGADTRTGGLRPDGTPIAAADSGATAPDVVAETGDAAAAPAEATVDAAPPLPLDELPEPEIAWSHPAGSFTPSPVLETPAGPALAAFDPDGAVSLLDARTGSVRWTARPAGGETWYGVDAGTRDGETLILVDATDSEQHALVLRLAADDGRTLWRTPVEEGFSVDLTEWGRGVRLESYAACAVRMLDPADGRLLGPRLRGPDSEVWDHRGHAARRCGLSDIRTFGVAGGVGVVARGDREGRRLEGFGPAETPRWTRTLTPTGLVNAVLFDRHEGIFVEYDGQRDARARRVVRLDLRTGAERWAREFDLSGDCPGPYIEGRVRPVPGPQQRATAVLVPDCVITRSLDPADGRILWEVATGGFPVVEGEEPEEFGAYGADPLALQRLHPDGTPAGSLVLPGTTRYFWPLADGVVATALEPPWTAFVGHDGSVRWEAAVHFGNVLRRDAAFAIVPPDVHLLIEPTTGGAWKLPGGSPRILGCLAAGEGGAPLWLAMRGDPAELVGLRTTGEGFPLPRPSP